METKPYEMLDTFWKNWAQSLSMLSNAGNQMEQLTLETMKQQQEALHKMTEAMQTMEQELKHYTTQINGQYTDYMKQMGMGPLNSQMEEWQGKWNELLQQMQQYSMSPAKASVSLLSQASGQLEEAMKQTVLQSQNQREEVQKQMQTFLEELKAMQLDLMKKFEEGSKSLLSTK